MLEIVRTSETHFEGLRAVFDAVAREGRYLAFVKAPPRDEVVAHYRNILAHDWCHFVAVLEGRVVGWCGILPVHGEARAHVGTLGIALLSDARRRGFGARLIEAALAEAERKGLSRIELTVRTDNENAKKLYERFEFDVEGVNRRAFCVDGAFYDTYTMARVRSQDDGAGAERQLRDRSSLT